MTECRRPLSDLVVFVGGLESKTTCLDLLRYFGQFGIIRGCELQCFKSNPAKCRGFALIDIGDSDSYETILLTRHRIGDRPIQCKPLIQDKDELVEYNQSVIDRKVFVSGLPKKVTDQMLKEHFEQFGPVELAYIIKHHKDNKSKGFGFVCFEDKESKYMAIDLADRGELIVGGKAVSCINYNYKTKENGSPNDTNNIVNGEREVKNYMNSDDDTVQMPSSKNQIKQSTNSFCISGDTIKNYQTPFYSNSSYYRTNKSRMAKKQASRVESISPQEASEPLPTGKQSSRSSSPAFNLFAGSKILTNQLINLAGDPRKK